MNIPVKKFMVALLEIIIIITLYLPLCCIQLKK